MYFTEYSDKTPEEISFCVSIFSEVNGEYIKHLPAHKAISTFHRGAYEGIPETRKKLIKYAEEHSLELSGIYRNFFMEGPPQHKDSKKFITQIIALIN